MHSIFQISEAVSLALHSMELIAKSGKKLSAGEIARKINASENHLSKVLQRLGKSGLVSAIRGPGGGFTLSKGPREISFLDIYEAIEGRVAESVCPFQRPQCPFSGCMFEGFAKKMTEDFQNYFRNRNLGSGNSRPVSG